MKDFSRFFHTRSDTNTSEIRAYLFGLLQAKRHAKNLERMEKDVVDFNFAGETTPRFVGTVPASEQMQDGVLRFSLARKGWIPTASHLTYEASDQQPAFQPSFVVLQGM